MMKCPSLAPKWWLTLIALVALIPNSQAANNTILFKTGTITPQPNTEQIASQPDQYFIHSNEVVKGYYYRLLQFHQLPTPTEKTKIAQNGILLLDYIPHNTYIAAIPHHYDLSQLPELNVRAILFIKGIYKLSPSLLEAGLNNAFPEHAVKQKGTVDLHLKYYDNLQPANIIPSLQAKGATLIAQTDQLKRMTVRIPTSELELLVSLPFISYLELIPPPGEPEDLRGRTMHRSNQILTDQSNGLKLDGNGVNVGLNDDGILGPHIDFTGRLSQDADSFTVSGTHGDMTGGIIAGAGNLNPDIKGMAPGVFLFVREYNADMPGTEALHLSDQVMIFSTSYSNGCNDGYTTTTELVDQEIYDNPSLIQVFSAGNSNGSNCGYGAGNQWGNITGGHKVGKNVIATANLWQADNLESSSSRGPAADGRLKPDISANGDGQWSTDPDNAYEIGGGTSAAAPGISGVLAQLYQGYRDLNGGADPESALMKAALLNTATDLGNPGPDFKYGWGRVHAKRAWDILVNNQYLNNTINQLDTNQHTITVPAGAKELRVMVNWTDPPASVSAGKDLVNNLDMVLEDPNTNTFQPWVLDPTPDPVLLDSNAVRGTDTLNNMEQVTILDPVAGTYTIKIMGTEIPQGPQTYYVVYDIVMSDLALTYPNGGEHMVPGQEERIRWDMLPDTNEFIVDYSLDNGMNWHTIDSHVVATDRLLDWVVPDTNTTQGLIRVQRGGSMDQNLIPFTIMPRPDTLLIHETCVYEVTLKWPSVPKAVGYTVYQLGSRYMDSVVTTTDTFAIIPLSSPNTEEWFSVAAIGPNGEVSKRTWAIFKAAYSITCSRDQDISIAAITSPPSEQTFECASGTQLPVQFILENVGALAVSNIPVHYQVNGGSAVSETLNLTLNNGDTATYSFTIMANLGIGNNEITVWTELPTDENIYNDTMTAIYQIMPSQVITTQFFEHFGAMNLCGILSDCGQTTCDLTNNSWVNQTNFIFDDIDWRVNDGSTPTFGTGPTGDHTSSNGKYIYLESSGECTGQEAILISPCIDLSLLQDVSFSFWYHMRGSSMGELHVDVFADGAWQLDMVPAIVGNQGSEWLNVTIPLTPWDGKLILIRFRGITGPDFNSDICLDDISIGTAPEAGITITGTKCLNQPITFTSTLTDPSFVYEWEFGPGASIASANTMGPHVVTYNTIGPKAVSLAVNNGFASDTVATTVLIPTKGQVASFFYSFLGDGVTIKFNNNVADGSAYFWDFGDGTTLNQMSPIHTYSQDGSYQVTSIVTNPCFTDTSSQTVNIKANGIEPLQQETAIRLYPNPTDGLLTVQLEGFSSQTVQLEVTNIHGQKVFTRTLPVGKNQTLHQIDLSAQPKGIYFVQVQGPNLHQTIKLGVL